MSEKYINNKCDKCGAEEGVVFKGQNNTRLCGGNWYNKGCGRNICFICGKKETRTEWRKEKDCCGNEVMREREVEMYKQEERDENDPNNPEMKLRVHYCGEHKEEAKKSPLKWTHADGERIEKEKEQKKLEIAEKLNSQSKGLFYLYDAYPRSVEYKKIKGIEYGCVYFWGKENGQNFFLMVPDTHPVLNDLKYTEKVKSEFDGREYEYTRYNLKKQFYLIEGVDNLPLETTDNRYEGNDPYAKAYRFSKFVGLSDKIKLIPIDSQGKPKKEQPIENKPTDKLSDTLPKELNDKTLLQYFQNNNIKLIKLENNKLVIKCNNKPEKETKAINNQELEQIKLFAEKIGKNEFSLSDLEQNNQSNSPDKSNKGLYIGLAVVGALVIGLVAWLLMRKNRIKKH